MRVLLLTDRDKRVTAEQVNGMLADFGYQGVHREVMNRMKSGAELRLTHSMVGMQAGYLRERGGEEWTMVPLWVCDELLRAGALRRDGQYLRLRAD